MIDEVETAVTSIYRHVPLNARRVDLTIDGVWLGTYYYWQEQRSRWYWWVEQTDGMSAQNSLSGSGTSRSQVRSKASEALKRNYIEGGKRQNDSR